MSICTPKCWQPVIPLNVTEPVREKDGSIPNYGSLASRDICSHYLEHKTKYYGWRIFFCKDVYPDASGETLKALQANIIQVALDNGCYLVKGGSSGVKDDGRKKYYCFNCGYYKKFQTRTTDTRDLVDYKDSTIRNDRRTNNRGSHGKTLARRRNSDRELNNKDTCRFRISIQWDDNIGAWCIPISNKATYTHKCRREGITLHSKNEVSYKDLNAEQVRHIQIMFQLDSAVPVATVIKSFVGTFNKVVSRNIVEKVRNATFPQLTGTDVDQALQYLKIMEHDHVVLQQDKEDGPLVSNGKAIGLAPSIGDYDMEEVRIESLNYE